ncbi:cytochrome c oxidase subunit 3 family protein [bacterium]|nr:cytochrome c oxidase subunit 3 family protein [bacterium]
MARHATHLAHHFDSPTQQFESSKLGMWLFLATEILLFGGLFVAYAVYRTNHPEIFAYAHHFLDKSLGGLNTVVLICSSLTMALAVRAAQLGRRERTVRLLAITLLCGLIFLGVKVVEYKAKWEHGLLWGRHYQPALHEATAGAHTAPTLPAPPAATGDGSEASLIAPAAPAPRGLAAPAPAASGAHEPPGGVDAPKNVHIFFGIYFAMTGLHGIHVLAGMIAITWILLRARRGEFGPAYYTPVDLVGLYWHLVDLIWIYLFPLLYLIK